MAILEDHDFEHSDGEETLNLDYMADLCSRDWGLYKTVTNNLQVIGQFIECVNRASATRIPLDGASDMSKMDFHLNAFEKTHCGRSNTPNPCEFFSVSAYIPLGWSIGATPDGRQAGEPLADTIAPRERDG